MSDTVYAIVSIYDNAELLPHFLSHYSELGVNRILVVVRSANRGELYDAAMTEAVRYPASVDWFPATVFSDRDKADVEQRVLQANAVQPDDYVMHLDLDEFQEYPAPLSVIVREMNAYNDWALRGDRTTAECMDAKNRAMSRASPAPGRRTTRHRERPL